MGEYNINQAQQGLITNTTDSQMPKGSLTYALNAQIGNFDGNEVTYQNEQSNLLCLDFPQDLKVIGVFNITQANKVLYFLTDETNHEIGFVEGDSCNYQRLLWGDCFNFSINNPVQQIVVKQTNCSIQVYWTDNNNSMRYFDFEDLPWKEDINKTKLVGELDCNKILVQPNFSIPQPEVISVEDGGNLATGTYQYVTQYANMEGLGYTQFYNVSNPVSINQTDRATQDFNLPTSKAIRVRVEGLDNSGIFDYFNLVAVETVNAISTFKLVGTYPVTTESQDILHTGSATAIQLSEGDIFQKYQFYDTAEGVTQSDSRIIWYNLKEKQRINYQEIWGKVNLLWETAKLPYNEFEGYNKALNTYSYKGYMRDEVYAFEGMFILKNGKETDAFHIPGRVATPLDRLQINNEDSLVEDTKCEDIRLTKEAWQVYNTATKLGYTEEYINSKQDDCYKGPYEYGEMAYWESEEKYPNTEIWGDLANQPIRHHKFPDSLITHIHDNSLYQPNYKSLEPAIYPIGVRIDAKSLYQAIQESSLTQEQKDEIVGFKILRGDRSIDGYKSIRAKGLMNNVGYTEYDGKEQYFPNYPYNDLRPDPYFVREELPAQSGFRPDKSIDAFKEKSKSRFTFHSPDTHFYQALGVDSGFLKMETIEFGKSYGHFVPVEGNAEYKFLTKKVTQAALAIAQVSGLNIATGTFGWPSYTLSNILPAFSGAKELFEKLAKYTNFGWSFNSIGIYNSYYPVPNQGFKQRPIDYGKYIIDGNNSIEDGNSLYAFRRESSVYLHTQGDYKFPHEYSPAVPIDNSRYNISSYKGVDSREFWLAFTASGGGIIPDEFIKEFATNSETTEIQGYVSDYSNPDPNTYIYPQDVYRIDGTDYLVEIFNATYLDDPFTQRVYYTFLDPESVDFSTLPVANNFILVTKADPDNLSAPVFVTSNRNLTDENMNNQIIFRDIVTSIRTQFEIILTTGIDEYDSQGVIGDLALSIYYAYAVKFFNNLYPNINPDVERETDISSYYAAIKAFLPAQWGRMYTYSTIDTGFYSKLYDNEEQFSKFPTVFGGDTFINKFALKIKQPFFKLNTVGDRFANQADVAYHETGTINFPMFWISTKPAEKDLDINEYIDIILKEAPGGNPGGGFLSKLWNIIKNLFTGGAASSIRILNQMAKIIKEIGLFADSNINLDEMEENGLTKEGKMYLFAYGIPYFFCESQVNVDYRQATNDLEGNYYPRVGSGIPDDWVQEINVPIANDNNYTYNQTFSKQNKENFYSHLREDFDPEKECYFEFPNRAFWSEKTDLNETRNNWLIYKPLNRKDLDKSYGKLISLNGISNNQILIRYENKTQIQNVLTAINTNSPLTAYLGNSELFDSSPPVDVADTDNGSMGSQHKFLLKTENGVIYTDAKRGQVVLLRGTQGTAISEIGNSKWFANNLPFEITKFLPDTDIDNNFKGIGITGVYDEYYQRLILTKRDYKVKNPENIEVICGDFVDTSKKEDIIKQELQNNWKFLREDCNKLIFGKEETINTLPKKTDIFAFFDTTSMQPQDGVAASQALNNWYTQLKVDNPDFTGNLYIMAINTSANESERYLLHPNVILTGQVVLNTTPAWNSIHILPPNFNTPLWNAPKDVVCLSFVDETNPAYHGGTVNFSGQPTATFAQDYLNFKSVRPSFTYFRAVLYPIVQQVTGLGGALVLQSMAAIEGTTLTAAQIAATNTTVNVSPLLTVNPYEGFVLPDSSVYEPLKNLNWKGVYDKLSPASEVFSSTTFGQELTELLEMGSEETITSLKEIPLPIVEFGNEDYFEDVSWTMSFSFQTNTWISFHSYQPNYYVSHPTYFQSGLYEGTLWNHNKTLTSYCNFYGEQEDYTLEYPFVYKTQDELVQTIKDYCSALKYENEYEFCEPDEILYFNEAILFNRQQCSGLLELTPMPLNNLRAKTQFPKYKIDSKEITIAKEDNFINFNAFWDIVKNKSLPFQDRNKDLINSNLDYSIRSFNKGKLRAKDLRVRLTLNNDNTFKLISRFILTETHSQ